MVKQRTIHQARRQADHQPVGAPVSDVNVQVEPVPHQLGGIAAEVAIIVFVDEVRGGDPGTTRQRSQGVLSGHSERPIDRLELIVLAFAQREAPAAWKRPKLS